MPEPDYDINNYLIEHVIYPDSAFKYSVEGRVIVKFIVNEDGKISDCMIAKSLSSDCDEVALNAIKTMPKWKPGMKDGIPVKVWTMLPVKFILTNSTQDQIYEYTDQMPIIGCNYNKYIAENLRCPDSLLGNNTRVKVFVRFVVNENGTVSNAMILSNVSSGCNKEAIRLIQNMPPWTPARENGKPVKVWFNLPVPFEINNELSKNKVNGLTSSSSHDEEMPEPPYDLNMYLANNVRYPDSARENGLTGRVIVNFIVNENGSISDCKVKRGAYNILNEEALRVVNSMPPWIPGMQDGKPVKVYFTLPVAFSLSGNFKKSKKKIDKPEDYIYSFPSDQPDSWPETDYDIVKYIADHVKYPVIAQQNKIEGEVFVGFVVNKDGSITDCRNIDHLNGACDTEAIRVIKSLPNWKPATFNRKPVNAEQLIAVPFYPSAEAKLNAESKKVYNYVEQMPGPGYDHNKYIDEHLRYPDNANRKGITGHVDVKFIVTETGAIDSVRVVKGIGGGCDEEAIRIVKSMPPWKSGKQNGKPVKVYITLSVPFKKTMTYDEIVSSEKTRKAAIPKRTYDFLKYVQDSLHYPEYARINKIEGKVIIKFAVDEDGLISDCTVSEGLGYGCNEEALRLVKNMPPWTPGVKDGKKTKTFFTQSILFSLDSSDHNKSKRRKTKNGNSDE